MRIRVVHPLICAAFAAVACAGMGPASAAGVTRIQQSDGSVHIYTDVDVKLAGHSLWIESADKRGVLEIANGACSFAGAIERCLPDAIQLREHHKTHRISIYDGTVYLNLSHSMQPLPLSSEQLAPHSVLVQLHTVHGTYVSVKGTLDEVKP